MRVGAVLCGGMKTMQLNRPVATPALRLLLLAVLIFSVTDKSQAVVEPDWALNRSTTAFDRFYVTDPRMLDKITSPRNKAGLAGVDGWGVTGWFEYDFKVPKTGWYELFTGGENKGLGVEYILDRVIAGRARSDDYLYAGGMGGKADKVGNIWLNAGAHTLRLQRFYWTGFPALQSFTIRASHNVLGETVRVDLVGLGNSFQEKKCQPLRIYSGSRNIPDRLTVWVRDESNDELRSTSVVAIPRSSGLFKQETPIYCEHEGIYKISFGDGNGNLLSQAPFSEINYNVIATSAVIPTSRELNRTLITEIDCAAVAPDYSSGQTKIVRKPYAAYRESSGNDWFPYQQMDARMRTPLSEPSWFAYKLDVHISQRPYIVEVDYPDDATRTYAVVLRESNPLNYPVSAGIDSGGEFSLTHKTLTFSMIYWPRSSGTRIVFMPARHGSTAAVSRIRVYSVRGDLPPLDVPKSGGRHFVNWYEEGDNYMSIFGAPDDTEHGFIVSTERWAQAVKYMGGDTLSAAVNVYNFSLYPSQFNKAFSQPVNSDRLRQILLISEKYGLMFLPELHPRADELAWPYMNSPEPKPNLLVSKDGTTNYYAADGKTRNYPPHYNPLYPANQDWYVGMIGELMEKYRDSPVLLGVNLRLMQWQNPTLNNFHSLEWGYDDYTVGLFQSDTGIIVPGKNGEPRRFRQRYDWLMAHAREKWIAWRCQKIAQLYTRIRNRVRQVRPDLQIYSSIFDGYPSEFGPSWARDAGVDAELLSRIDGVVLINALHAYGRRYDDLTTQGTRDNLIDPQVLHSMIVTGRSGKFLSSTRYFEATEVIVPPQQLGFSPDTKKTWMGAAINPAGRNMLERYAVQLAETDASLLGDGGNGYTLGQPVLREFLQEYRHLPPESFYPRQDARDPVAVWELSRTSGFLFYLVNREPYAISVLIRLNRSGEVRRLSSGKKMNVANGILHLDLQPYQLMAFSASADAEIPSITTTIPPEVLVKVTSQVVWLEALNRDARNLAKEQQQKLQVAADMARAALDKRQVWRARMIMENHELLPIYRNTGKYPPHFRDDGSERQK